MSKCPYKSIFGEPRTGVHTRRIPVLDIALADTVMTVIGAWALQHWVFPDVPFWKVFLAFFIFGEILHWMTCVKTPVTQFFLDD